MTPQDNDTPDLPPILYKFRVWDWGNRMSHHKRIITHNEIYFSSPSKLNDPFDRGIMPRYGLESIEFNRCLFDRYQARINPTASDEWKRANFDNAMEYLQSNNLSQLQVIMEEIFAKHGVFTTAATRSNPLLWSHYASEHQGFCVGYDTKALTEYFDSRATVGNDLIFRIPVTYVRDYPVIMSSKIGNLQNLFEEIIRYKFEDWSYEKEYRFVFYEGANTPIGLENYLIKEVILGCEMPNKCKKEIFKLVRSKPFKIDIFEAYKSDDSFEVKFKLL